MITFWTDVFQHGFLQYALLAGILASVSCGCVGTFVVVRRSTYVAGALAHCVLGGMGAARYAQRVHGMEWLTPLLGAAVAAVGAALLISWITLKSRQRQDTILSAVWALGMAVGISFIHATPGYHEDLMSFLFGNILMVSPSDLMLMALLNALVVTVVVLFFDKLMLIIFQPELADLRGIRVAGYHTLFLVLTALTVVLLTQVVGLILVIALLTLPSAAAIRLTSRLWQATAVSMVFCLLCVVGGLMVSYGPEWPAGATVVECAGLLYLSVLGFQRFRERRKLRRARA